MGVRTRVHIMDSSDVIILVFGFIGLVFAAYLFNVVRSIKLGKASNGKDEEEQLNDDCEERMGHLYDLIRQGADAFLFAEYKLCALFTIIFAVVVLFLTANAKTTDYVVGALSAT